eukprot:scaffold66_cov115-Cylindrotheca_fusiformis.AAC.3
MPRGICPDANKVPSLHESEKVLRDVVLSLRHSGTCHGGCQLSVVVFNHISCHCTVDRVSRCIQNAICHRNY